MVFKGPGLESNFMHSLTSSNSPAWASGQSFHHSTESEFVAVVTFCYYRARYYDPSTGRFLSEDTVRTVNLYEYVKVIRLT